jgi:hypothetical protein
VQTVGVLVGVIGLVFLSAAWRGRLALETVILALGSAAGLTAIDLIFVSLGVIPPIYLADAAAEVILITAWIVALWMGEKPS